nr:putative ribonuclease H-like domain-containing protein [Tanacetum cinerariifolium]
ENQANKFAGLKKANNSAGTQANDDQSANSKEIDLHEEYFILPLWSAYSTTVKSLGDKIEKNTNFKTYEKPVSQVEQIFLEELEKLKRQEKEANDAAEPLRKEATHDIQNANTKSTKILNTISTPLSIAGPLRAFNDGKPSYLDDPSMPHLEDIYASLSERIFTDSSYDDEDLPFRKKAIRTKWVYRNKKDERGVVVKNKARFVTQGHRQEEGIDYDEVFAHVARIEAIRIFLAFASYMGFIVYQMDVKSAFLYGIIDEEVYVTQPPGFVDPKFSNKVYKVVKALYGLHQALRACVKTASTPIETQKPLVKDSEAADVDVTSKTSHLYAMKRIFRYLKGQPKLGLWYPKVSLFDLKAYSDSDYAGANLDRKSLTGVFQFLGRRLVSWQCKK